MKTINEINAFLLDMDGTFYLGDHLLPGALVFLHTLKEKGRKFSFLTNNSSKNRLEYQQKLIRLGLKAEDAIVLTSGDATVRYLLEHTGYRRVYLVGTPGLEDTFKAAGLTLDEQNPEVAVLGFDTTLTYHKICTLSNHLVKGLPFIATHPDINCPVPSGFIPDIGSMLAMIRTSTGREPDLVIGKPNRLIVDMLADSLGEKAEDCAMVGDRLYTDIALGKTSGVTTILMLSGETKISDLEGSDIRPDYIFDDLEALNKEIS